MTIGAVQVFHRKVGPPHLEQPLLFLPVGAKTRFGAGAPRKQRPWTVCRSGFTPRTKVSPNEESRDKPAPTVCFFRHGEKSLLRLGLVRFG